MLGEGADVALGVRAREFREHVFIEVGASSLTGEVVT
jgi:hypothetical protein